MVNNSVRSTVIIVTTPSNEVKMTGELFKIRSLSSQYVKKLLSTHSLSSSQS